MFLTHPLEKTAVNWGGLGVVLGVGAGVGDGVGDGVGFGVSHVQREQRAAVTLLGSNGVNSSLIQLASHGARVKPRVEQERIWGSAG